MQLLTILLSLAFARLWGDSNPVQRDAWFWRWCAQVERAGQLHNKPVVGLVLAVGVPVIGLLIAMALIAELSTWLLLPLAVLVLLYSLGRGSIAEIVDAYASAHANDNWHFGLAQARRLQVNTEPLQESDWDTLHEQVIGAASYRGFEQTFAPLFWFVLLGPVGAFGYRLSQLYSCAQPRGHVTERWLWLLEWPAVRLLGLSFAVTGNFVGCMRQWRECIFCAERSSREVLTAAATGALAVDADLHMPPLVTRHELTALQSLYRRTLWLWLGGLGLWAIVR